MADWLKSDTGELEVSLDTREVLEDELLAGRLVDLAVSKGQVLQLLSFKLLLKLVHQVETKHAHKVA